MKRSFSFQFEILSEKQFFNFSVVLIVILFYLCIACTDNSDDTINKSCESSAIFNPAKEYGVVVDQEGNVYKTIQIGSQTWMAENLRTTIYRNGDNMPEVKDIETWTTLNSGAYSNYNNTVDDDTICTYGRLYNWYVIADERQVAPEGWHVPTHEEWMKLEEYLGADTTVSQKLSETGSIHWPSWRDEWNSNETGFTALPGGYRPGFFLQMGESAYWWTSSEGQTIDDRAWHFHLSIHSYWTGGCECPKQYGKSIRCVKD